ncbi:GntR family transcriptional regulator [Paenibacillus foliorum]|nr:GntR family transcriptional regulator [Paenibacillus foliorum]
MWLFRRAGEKVNIDKLARDLEVSNIPIREALSRLSSEGFVGMIPY